MASIDSQAEIQQLRQIILRLYYEKEKRNVGLQNLVRQLTETSKENTKLKEKVKRLETMICRAENRIAQLTQTNGNTKACVTPGVSRKILDALTRENAKLSFALGYYANKTDVLTNVELYQENDRLKKQNEILTESQERLKSALHATDSELHGNILRLTTSESYLKRKIQTQTVFCESLLSKNDALKEKISQLNDAATDKIKEVVTLKKELSQKKQSNEIRDIVETVYG